MGSSKEHKKHKEKKKHKKRSRSKSRERDYKKHSHKSSRHREREKERSEKDRFEKEKTERERYERDRERERERIERERDREKDREKIKEKPHKRPLEEPELEKPNKKIKTDPDVKHAKQIKKDPSPLEAVTLDGQGHESLSIEDTNKLRAKLGLAPLKLDSNDGGGGEGEGGSKDPEEVFVPTPNLGTEAWLQKMRDKVAQQRQKRKISEKLKQVVPLSEQVPDEETATDWVLRSRQLQKEKDEAEKRAKLLEDLDQEFGVDQLVTEEFKAPKHKTYTSQDLKHLTIGHSQTVFQEGREVILTLKDQEVLDDADDVLENVNILDNLKAAKNVENKKCRPGYVPYEEPEYDEFGILKKKAILSKYDDEIEGKKPEAFKLGDSAAQEDLERQMVRARLQQQAGKILVSLQAPKLQPVSEYYTSEEMVQFKKIKKKRKVRKRGLKPEELMPLPGEKSKVDHGSRSHKTERMETDEPPEEDDDNVIVPPVDLKVDDEGEEENQVLSRVRRRLKQAAGVREVGQVVRETLEQLPEDAEVTEETAGNSVGNISIVLNSTKEFCRKLGDIPTYGMSGNRDQEEIVAEEPMEEEEPQSRSPPQQRGAWNEVDPEAGPSLLHSAGGLQPILEEEPDLSHGLAGALKLATKKGYLEKELDKPPAGASRLSNIQAKSYTIEEKFYEDDKFGSKRGERYSCGPVSDFREKDTYKPDVKLEYIDDSGRKLTAKEAFRYLSHKFHGKGPGKNKVDKRMKKLEQDAKLKQMSSTDTPLSTVKLLQEKQRELQAPFILLSGGGSKALAQSSTISKSK